jgi:hypothetical protein
VSQLQRALNIADHHPTGSIASAAPEAHKRHQQAAQVLISKQHKCHQQAGAEAHERIPYEPYQ